jgi:hypothetical protein
MIVYIMRLDMIRLPSSDVLEEKAGREVGRVALGACHINIE